MRAVDGVSLEIEPGTVHVLLGRSGSGKTTLLRAIAGFEPLAAGRIEIRGRVVDRASSREWVPPEKRRIGFVFQDYALFPHLDARSNVAFGAPGNKEDKLRASNDWLSRVRLADYAERKPGALSGGEQQRVALARALAQKPDVVLLDEPFSNLDSHLRRHVRDETIALIREAGATAIFVTHDVEEAFSVADRLSVLHSGRLEQTGDARTLYERPASIHVARLCGPAELLEIERVRDDGRVECALGVVETEGTGNLLVVRPEQLTVRPGNAANLLSRRYLGAVEELEVQLSNGVTVVARQGSGALARGEERVDIEVRGPLALVESSAASSAEDAEV